MIKIFIKIPFLIQYLPKKIKQNRKFLAPILYQNPKALKYVSEEIQEDSQFILSILKATFDEINQHIRKKEYYYLKYASFKLKKQPLFIIDFFNSIDFTASLMSYPYIDSQLTESPEFWHEFIESNPNALYFFIEKSIFKKEVKHYEWQANNESIHAATTWLNTLIEKKELEKNISLSQRKNKIQKI